VQIKTTFQLLSVSSGIALQKAGLFFHTSTATSIELQITFTPIPDRFAQPTQPVNISQVERGGFSSVIYGHFQQIFAIMLPFQLRERSA
jgi:hypothetical protein